MPFSAAVIPELRTVHGPPTPGLVTIVPALPTPTQGMPKSHATAVNPALPGLWPDQVVPPFVVLRAMLALVGPLPSPTATHVLLLRQAIALRPSLLVEKSVTDQLAPPFVGFRHSPYGYVGGRPPAPS